MVRAWREEREQELRGRHAAGDPCVFPLNAQNWEHRRAYRTPETLCDASSLEDLKQAVQGIDEDTCLRAIEILGRRSDMASIHLLRAVAWGEAVYSSHIAMNQAVSWPSHWMKVAAREGLFGHPVAFPLMVQDLLNARMGTREMEVLAQKLNREGRLDAEVEAAFLHVVRNGLAADSAYRMAEVEAAITHLGHGCSKESLQILLTGLRGDRGGLRKACRMALQVRKQWDLEAADALIDDEKLSNPHSIYHACRQDEARDYECFAQPGIRERLEAKYSQQRLAMSKADEARHTAQRKQDAHAYAQKLKRERRWFLGPISTPGERMDFFGEEKKKPLWMQWLREKCFSNTNSTGLGFIFKSFFLLGWVGFAHFVFALHSLPGLWLVDRLIARNRMSRPEYEEARKTLMSWASMWRTCHCYARGDWQSDRSSQAWEGFHLSRKPYLAALAAIITFVVTCPLLVLSVPYAFWASLRQPRSSRLFTFRIRPERWDYHKTPSREFRKWEVGWLCFKWGFLIVACGFCIQVGLIVFRIVAGMHGRIAGLN